MKKRMDASSVKSTAPNTSCRASVQTVFNQQRQEDDQKQDQEHNYHEPNLPEMAQHQQNASGDLQQCRFLPRLQGVENEAFQKQEISPQKAEPTESEVYFADVSSCCNISVRNDGQDSSLYDEALDTQKPRLISLQCVHKQAGEKDGASNANDDEEYIAQRMGKRQMSTRSRLPFPLPSSDSLSEMTTDSCMQLLPKDISQNSLCSSVQTPLTETTDDSPMTPNFPKNDCCIGYFPEKNTNAEKMKMKTQRHPQQFSNANLDQFLAPDAQYEVIDDQETRQNQQPTFSNLTNTISGLNNYGQSYLQPNFLQNRNNFTCNSPAAKNIPPKTLNLNQSPSRRNLGSNISTLIQNLGVNPAGLLYGEANSMDDEMQGQGCHSDGTMDSGWQSGSEKQEKKEDCENATHKPVNV